MIRNLVFKAETTEPSIGKVEVNLLTQSALGTDRIAVTNQQHSDHQFRINRRTTCVAVERRDLRAEPAQIEDSVNPAQKMIGGNPVIKIELIEKPVLLSDCCPHHHRIPSPKSMEKGITFTRR